MVKSKILKELKRRKHTWKVGQDEQTANGPDDISDVIYMNLKWKKTESAPWRAYRKIWDRLFSPTFSHRMSRIKKELFKHPDRESNLPTWIEKSSRPQFSP